MEGPQKKLYDAKEASKGEIIEFSFIEVILFSPCLWASFHPHFPLFTPQSKEVLLNLGMMKC
jgi:hypothetical protein